MFDESGGPEPFGKVGIAFAGEAPRAVERGRKAVVYVTSQPFLYPTLVSALQVERQRDLRTTDVVIYLVDVDEEATARAGEVCAANRIRLERLDARLFALPPGVEMLPSHVPAASLARLVLEQVIDPIYERILYLDGDTLVLGDLRPLLAFDPPKGRIGAVRGSVWLAMAEQTRQERSDYVAGLGLQHPESYFNAGVLSLWREDLREFGAAAFNYFVKNAGRCRFHDQSALNHVFDGRVSEIWPGFNYHVPYQELLAPRRTQPALVHFTGPVKPWKARVGRFAHFADMYDAFDREWPSLSHLRMQHSVNEERDIARRLVRAALRDRLHWIKRSRRRKSLLRYLAAFDTVLSDRPLAVHSPAAVT